MIGLLFNVPEKDRQTLVHSLWTNLCERYGLTPLVYMRGGRWSEGATPSMVMEIEEAQALIRGVQWVVLLPRREAGHIVETVPLAEFQHPADNVVYVVGPNAECLDMTRVKADAVVSVETVNGYKELHAFTAAAIVAYDRWRKLHGQARIWASSQV